MKKIILLIVCIFTLTGCNVEYNLNIDKFNITESINLTSTTEDENEDISVYSKPIQAFLNTEDYSESTEEIEGVSYYKIEKDIFNNPHTMNINYKFLVNEFKKSNIANNAVSTFSVKDTNDTLQINSGTNIKAFNLNSGIDNLKVKITYDENIYELVKSNADTTEGSSLIWNVTKETYKKSPISVELKKKGSKDNNQSNNNDKNNNQNNNNNNNNSNENNKTTDIVIGNIKINRIVLIAGMLGVFFLIVIIVIIVKQNSNKNL